MSAKRRNITVVIVVLALLAAAIAVLALINRPGELPESGSVAVKMNGETLRTFDLADLQSMEYVEVQKEIVSSSYGNDEGLFRGVAVSSLLEAAGVKSGDYQQAVARSEDGFVTAFPADEIEDGGIILVYSKNGESLGSLANGGSGPLRILAVEDEFGNRCAKYVSEIEVK